MEPGIRKAGVWLRRAHKGFGERSFPSRTKYATLPAGRTAPATVYKCALVNKGLMACTRILAGLQSIPQTPADGNADLTAMDTLSPGDFRLLDTGNVVGVNTAGLCRSGMSQSHRQSCNQV